MDTTPLFEALPLATPLQQALAAKGYTTPSPIQSEAIPRILEGRDILAAAQTGTGKTAAFSLPVLHRLHNEPGRTVSGRMRVLVLTPTRELAVQVANSFKEYGRNVRAYCGLVYGGVGMVPQIKMMKRGVDILVATPGRLLDLYQQGHVDFGGVEHFILDEADRMLDMGFIHDIKRIVAELPRKRQSLFFSATLPESVVRLAGSILNDPIEIRIAPKVTTAENIEHRVCFLDATNKPHLLSEMLKAQAGLGPDNLTIVFSRTKHGADRIAKSLSHNGLQAESIHGNKTQAARQKALDRFREGRTPILVATDVAARGIDVKDITLVINYDIPNDPDSYAHRIGRTARAGKNGVAYSFCTNTELRELSAVEKAIRKTIEVHTDHPYHQEGLAARHNGSQGRNQSGPRPAGGRQGKSRSSNRSWNNNKSRRPARTGR